MKKLTLIILAAMLAASASARGPFHAAAQRNGSGQPLDIPLGDVILDIR
ncbi:MAG: hypothetical protein GY771_14935 [bacterium]|nr:hypothetical protein [bacterium]